MLYNNYYYHYYYHYYYYYIIYSFKIVKPANNKLGILEEDDEFEEFPVEGTAYIFI